jgi:hypothetical protein
MLSGCTGVRHSYQSLQDDRYDKPVIELAVGDKKEVLCVGNGFPGWWGTYPEIVSMDSKVASISCRRERGLIPFREPGIIFGGQTCTLNAHEVGATWLLDSYEPGMREIMEGTTFPSITDETHFPPEIPNNGGTWILLKVVPTKEKHWYERWWDGIEGG